LIVVSNSSPIMNLAAIGRLDLIKHKFGKVVIPDAVWRELVIDIDNGESEAIALAVENNADIERFVIM